METPDSTHSVRTGQPSKHHTDSDTEFVHAARLAEALLRKFGLDEIANRHYKDTPERFVKMLEELTIPENFQFTTFPNKDPRIDEMVVVQDIPFYTLCAHHIIPFFGYCHIAYIPEESVAGLSKFARTVKAASKGFHIQEELTASIADFIEKRLEPKGVAVVMRAEHLCMTMRGVQVPGTQTTTSSMRGVFLDPEKGARQEFLSLINGH